MLGSSRLVRCLTELSVATTRMDHGRFTERLAHLIDFADSIALADAHARPLQVQADCTADFAASITAEFLRARSGILQQAMRGFAGTAAPARHRWPTTAAGLPGSAGEAAAPYLRFYNARQAEADTRVRGLHQRTRQALGGLSPRLARLCALDDALGEPLALHSRRILATVPKLLALRLEYLLETQRDALSNGDAPASSWPQTLERYRREARGLLLAEIELRMLPTLGLIEALNEET